MLPSEATMQKDIYTKAILTIIAVALSIVALNPWIAPLESRP
jgi:hypothetical protein